MAPPVGTSDWVGKLIGNRYRVVRLVGQGGMGVVYEAHHEKLGGRVAIKMLNPSLASKERECKRFLREARAAYRLKNEHVVRILDFAEEPIAYFVMELLEGRDLDALLRLTGRLDWPRAAAIVLQILEALDEAHENGIVHRDLKPSNIFIVDGRETPDFAKVLDFGLAKVAESSPLTTGISVSQEFVGTVAYMSPEQAWGKAVDRRTDVYSLGIVFHQLLTGRLPFDGTSPYAIVDQHIRVPARRPSALEPTIPRAIDAIVLKALAKSPKDRFETAQAFSHALREAIRPGCVLVRARRGRPRFPWLSSHLTAPYGRAAGAPIDRALAEHYAAPRTVPIPTEAQQPSADPPRRGGSFTFVARVCGGMVLSTGIGAAAWALANPDVPAQTERVEPRGPFAERMHEVLVPPRAEPNVDSVVQRENAENEPIKTLERFDESKEHLPSERSREAVAPHETPVGTPVPPPLEGSSTPRATSRSRGKRRPSLSTSPEPKPETTPAASDSDASHVQSLKERIVSECQGMNHGGNVLIEIEIAMDGSAYPDIHNANKSASECARGIIRRERFDPGDSRKVDFVVVLLPFLSP